MNKCNNNKYICLITITGFAWCPCQVHEQSINKDEAEKNLKEKMLRRS